MKLNHHAKELRNLLEALDFRYDEKESQRRGCGSYYHHHADPDQYIKVFGRITPMAARTAMDKARQIAGLSAVGKPASAAIKENARIKRELAKEKRAKDVAEREARANAAGERRAEIAREIERANHDREIRGLMNPGFGR